MDATQGLSLHRLSAFARQLSIGKSKHFSQGIKAMKIRVLKDEFTVYQYEKDDFPGAYLYDHPFISITSTGDEISVVTAGNNLKGYKKAEEGWRALKIDEILDFGAVGVIRDISGILADLNTSIFVISTFNTDYIMVKKDRLESSTGALKERGYSIEYE